MYVNALKEPDKKWGDFRIWKLVNEGIEGYWPFMKAKVAHLYVEFNINIKTLSPYLIEYRENRDLILITDQFTSSAFIMHEIY